MTKTQIGLLFPDVGTLKFGFGDLLLFGLLFKILMATLGDFSILFCRQQAVDFDLRMKNE